MVLILMKSNPEDLPVMPYFADQETKASPIH
jgi:hypothetical protein